MTEKMLELAEKIADAARRWDESAREKEDSRYSIPKHAVVNALMDLAHDIRSTFTPRDENASPSAATANTLTFGGPALRVAFHFDGDRLVRWEILEQREELRGIGLRGSIRSGNFPALYSDNVLHIRGKQYEKDSEYPIYGRHTRATITALGAKIDQVNRKWCEKLGIGDGPTPKAERDYAYSLVEAAKEEIERLRRQLDAAEKVIEAWYEPNVTGSDCLRATRDYRTTYPKTGGAK